MFSARSLLKKAKHTFGLHWTRREATWRIVGAAVLFFALWTMSALGGLRTFVPHTFQLVGWPGTERHYLVLFQNNAELRATGGFITAFAQVDFKNGLPSGFSLQDVYGPIDDHEYLSPPYPMDELLEKDSDTYAGYSFRDTNHNPDFPQATEEIVQFFHKTNPDTEIDGVFAVNFSVLEDLLALYEPMHIDRYTLTHDNLFETLEAAVSDIDRHNIDQLSTRKDILKSFSNTLLRRMILSPWKWRSLSETITQDLNQKEILLSFNNHALEEKMKDYGWEGSFPSLEEDKTDVLAVNVSNYGGMKSDRYLTRDVHYTVEMSDEIGSNGQPVLYSTLAVTLTHHGSYNTPLSGGYKGYVRAFLPMGAELIESSTGASVEEFITGYTSWGDLVYLLPDKTVTFTYRFKLSEAAYNDGLYRLHLVKQPGTEDDYYEVVFKSPVGRNLLSAQMDARENVAFFKETLEADLALEVEVLPDETGPRVYEHEIVGLNVIDISFAEALDAETASDLLYYEIQDLNANVPGITDTVSIDRIVVEDGTLRIYTIGMTLQPEEHYQILLRNVRDRAGNTITPNPRTLTVVQRLE